MNLFERVKIIAKKLAGSETKLATALGLQQRTFNGYLNAKSQKNLWEHLPQILELFPLISRNWLYFGEGEMLLTDQLTTPAKREGKISNAVESAQPANESLNQRVAELERENAELNVELRGAFKEVRRLNEERRELEDRLKAIAESGPFFLEPTDDEPVTTDKPAHGVCGVDASGVCSK